MREYGAQAQTCRDVSRIDRDLPLELDWEASRFSQPGLEDWLRGHGDYGFAGLADGRSAALLLIPVVLLAVGIVAARRRGERDTVRFLALTASLGVAGWFALSRIEGQTIPYLFLWRPVLAIAIVLGVEWALGSGAQLVRRSAAAVLGGKAPRAASRQACHDR